MSNHPRLHGTIEPPKYPPGSEVDDDRIPKSYDKFLKTMGELLSKYLPSMDRERDELDQAEAEVRRLKSQLAVAEERQELARERYRRNRLVFMEMFDTWKDEVRKPHPVEDEEIPA